MPPTTDSLSDSVLAGGHGPRVGPPSDHLSKSGSKTADDSFVDRELIEETRNQIRSLVEEIHLIAQSDCGRTEFYQGFLTRVTGALASTGGAIWSVAPGGEMSLEYQINLGRTGLADDAGKQLAHGRLLEQLAISGEPTLVPPRSGSGDERGNPTDMLLVIAPLTIEQRVVGLVEIFQRPGSGPTTQRGYLRFLAQVARVAGDFLRNDQLRSFTRRESMWNRLESFVAAVHGSLDSRQTVYAIANEGRRVLECERVSVAVRIGGRMVVQAVSGLDSIERRADQVKRLGRLASSVARAGQPLWYTGDDSRLPPQIESQLHEYLDVSHSKLVIIQPLRRPLAPRPGENEDEDGSRREGPVIGALIVEQLGDERAAAALRERVETVTGHANVALANALDYSSLFLAPLWTRLGRISSAVTAPGWPRRLTIPALLLLAVISLWFLPAAFTLRASGRLVPEMRTEIFAEVDDAVLQELRVPEDPDAIVEKGDILGVMTSNRLDVEIQNLRGQVTMAEEKARKLQRAVTEPGLSPVDRGLIDGDLTEAVELYESVRRQLEMRMTELEKLTIIAPASGHVVNWQLRQNLLRRPVTRGQNLMTIVSPETPWQLELEFPERRVVHLVNAMTKSAEPLTVTFTLASHPGAEFHGRLVSIDNKLDVRGDEGNALLVRVAFDSNQMPRELLRGGTRVTAQIHAGNRSLGYVWFHELLETAHATWLLWF